MKNNVKITTLGSLMGWVCPYKCRGCGKIGEALCACCIFYIRASFCHFSHQMLDGKMFVGGMRDGLLSRCLIDFKYNSVRGLARPLAEILAAAVPEIGAVGLKTGEVSEIGADDSVVVVPLPTIDKHIRARGFDHTFLLAKEFAKIKGWRCEKILVRRNATVQVGADAETRVRQAKEAYGVNEALLGAVGRDKVFLLVDDIYTTGASLNAAQECLTAAGVETEKIYKAVVAKSGSVQEDNDEAERCNEEVSDSGKA